LQSEQKLQTGKVQNLRIALRSTEQVEIPAGAVYSFWAQIGRATKRRGYVEGRQISEGCLIPAIGGGLCQLSNALYEAALQAGLEIVERHPHSMIVPGSAAEQDRDATVFWNYLDLRFRSATPVLLTAQLTDDELIVQLHAKTMPPKAKPAPAPIIFSTRPVVSVEEHSCGSCEQDCFRASK
jgi:vancomycin resistance protein YoaR